MCVDLLPNTKEMLLTLELRGFPSPSRDLSGSNVFGEMERSGPLVIVLEYIYVRGLQDFTGVADGVTRYIGSYHELFEQKDPQ